jgi:hypothetical protein
LSEASERKPNPKKRAKKRRRRRFESPASNYQTIARQQKRYRKQKRRFRQAHGAAEETFTPEIIEEIEKSERAWDNALRRITRAEHLDGFED